MPASITTNQVWHEVEKQLFAVVGMVTAKSEARTAGIVYAARDRQLYFTTDTDAWKAKHIAQNPHVSLTVTIPKRIPFLSWIKIPAATITFQGEASTHALDEVDPGIHKALLKGLEISEDLIAKTCVVRIQPKGHFVTYGVGVSLATMRKPEEASGRTPV